MHKIKSLILLFIFSHLFLLPFSLRAGTLAFETIDQGHYSGYTEKNFLAIKTQEEWHKIWNIHTRIKLPLPVLPEIDFNRQMVMAVFTGEYPTSGYSIKIDHIEKTEDKILIYILETKPRANEIAVQVVTSPYQIVQMEKTDLPVEFQENSSPTKAGSL